MDETDQVLTSRPYGGLQVQRKRRTAFSDKRRRTFLEHVAATCNVTASAEAAGVTVNCVYQTRMRDEGFRAAWGAAIEQGYARLEARALAEACPARVITIDGDLVVDEGPIDRELTWFLLREHKKRVAGTARAGAARRADTPWAEVEAHFLKRLKAMKVRIDAEAGAEPGGAADGGATP